MKKLICVLLAAVMLFGLCSCGSDNNPGKGSVELTPPPVDEDELAETVRNELNGGDDTVIGGDTDGGDEPVVLQPSGTTSGDVGDYHVEIKSAELMTSLSDRVVVVNYAWTNNSDSAASASVTLVGKAYQDGTALENVIVLFDGDYDLAAASEQIQPGETLDVWYAYYLSNETSSIEYEVSEMSYASDASVTATFDPSSAS